ncbi:conserved hypothetical protein [Photorhabdus asymbiotica]|uniref:Hypothetical transmembrane protein n=1 Tax=Photorhabdus asymbiotica subsp. asymbiotica (strain ATCC 43949 / 3105-77) TaxID=553480 RepID=B6VMH2_PHOAA|nr:conserved hypothetical protein [Photorhabdus asymbiotica]CAR67352.1 hypothetical transmembrane protein [Photorhabdus asymbiotica subsp. asymbiotica ATCC 43949]
MELFCKVKITEATITDISFIPVIFQVASLLAALSHPGHIVSYAPGDSLPGRRDAS